MVYLHANQMTILVSIRTRIFYEVISVICGIRSAYAASLQSTAAIIQTLWNIRVFLAILI